jgi:transposase
MKKLIPSVEKVNAEVIGLDVHKDLTVFSHLNRRGEEVESGKLASSREDLCLFLKSRVGRRKTHIAFEASRSSLWVYEMLVGMYGKDRVHLGQASKIRAIANSKRKNDFNDAWWLAYLTYEGRLPESYVPEGNVLELRIATRERMDAVRRRTKVINRLRSHLAQIGEQVPSTSIKTQIARNYLIEKVLEVDGVRGRALQSCLQDLEYQDASIAEWNELIDELVVGLPQVDLIAREIPAVGRILAATIVAETGDIVRFTSAKAYACYTGLTPSDRSSGGKEIHGRITREGSPYLRWALNQAVIGCGRMRQGPGYAVGEWVRTKKKRLGNGSKARAAAARKLAESIWRLFHYGEIFDMARPFGGARMHSQAHN